MYRLTTFHTLTVTRNTSVMVMYVWWHNICLRHSTPDLDSLANKICTIIRIYVVPHTYYCNNRKLVYYCHIQKRSHAYSIIDKLIFLFYLSLTQLLRFISDQIWWEWITKRAFMISTQDVMLLEYKLCVDYAILLSKATVRTEIKR